MSVTSLEKNAALTDGPLLDPVMVGPYLLKNRFVLPPLTRSRAGVGDVPTEMHAIYYGQRAHAGLQITEGSPISQEATGFPWTPGIYTAAQIDGWKLVTGEVHRRGSRIFLQLWHVGRQSHSSLQKDNALPVAPSAVPATGQIFTSGGMRDFETPRALEAAEIRRVVKQFGAAARNALEAGFDGVEVHGANGYLIDQFLCEGSNTRTDEYGGSITNRIRFLREIVEEVISVWGSNKVGVRLTPSSVYGDMFSSDKLELYSTAVKELDKYGLAYLHLVEPNVKGSEIVEAAADAIPTSHFRSLYSGTIVVAGGLTFEAAERAVLDGVADLVGFGKAFIANPDLPVRYLNGAQVHEPDSALYYGGDEAGYTDYPSCADEEYLARLRALIVAGRVSQEDVLASLNSANAGEQIDGGAYYARLVLNREAS
ncbi:alkene reductase [Arthrobacter sp. StoSoilB20]|uniref:alkene reductase n=1 Tax=Arthrobacter sp. StoSoilB20 TaxID=2830995 RepID=UPI001CC5F9BB|nr:alkene reductase [Arthrobacter sp. StoSoilB20]BCW58540.1 alkene reductase [Arthrobacter sp. StoSoilB20]